MGPSVDRDHPTGETEKGACGAAEKGGCGGGPAVIRHGEVAGHGVSPLVGGRRLCGDVTA